jgi:hypothetical protein
MRVAPSVPEGSRKMNFKRSVMRWLAMAAVVLSLSAASVAQVFISVRIGPPALPVYAQPICPGPGYIWTPGYWSWNDDDGYYWVPGTWVLAPVGMLWTPGWWGWGAGFYVWHPGYWGPHVGFYGGINYGYGYGGVGFYGGEWRGGAFYYNRSVTNVSVTNVTNVYNKTVIVNNTMVNNISYNGGAGGVKAEPTAQEQIAEREQHTAALPTQMQHQSLASQNRQNFASVNQGKPAIAATAKAADFSPHSAIAARAAGGVYHPPAMSPKEARGPSTPGSHPFTPANSSNANRTVGAGTPAPQDRSNQGFRPFTPPNTNTAQKGQMGGNRAPTPLDKSNQGFRPFSSPNSGNVQRSQPVRNSAPQNRSNQEFRPFTPPTGNNSQSKGGSSNPAYQQSGRSGTNPPSEPRDTTVRRPSNPNPPSPQARPAPHQSKPIPPPHNQNPPKEDHHKGK